MFGNVIRMRVAYEYRFSAPLRQMWIEPEPKLRQKQVALTILNAEQIHRINLCAG
jgi:hypothetical protein